MRHYSAVRPFTLGLAAVAWLILVGAGLAQPRAVLPGGEDPAYVLAFSADGSTLVANGGPGMVTLWETLTHQRRGELGDPVRPVGSGLAAFSPDGRTLALCN